MSNTEKKIEEFNESQDKISESLIDDSDIFFGEEEI